MEPAELRERRQALHLTQASLGRVLGVTRNSIARWERGELPIRHPELVVFALDNLSKRLADGTSSDSGTVRAPHHNLPAELSSFVGREQELAQLVHRLGGARLLTVTGAYASCSCSGRDQRQRQVARAKDGSATLAWDEPIA